MDINELNKQVIAEFRANHGVVGGNFANVPLLLLETTGARSGEKRIKPLAYFADAERLIIIASYAGAEKSPPWFFNLQKHPEVAVEVGDEQFTARATIIDEPERTRLFKKMVEKNPVFAEYQAKTRRVIPVIALERVA